MDILTQNPEVWKKTIFILTYDENDGYFDHAPPFVAPNPRDETTGKTSAEIDTSVDYVTMEQERKKKIDEKYMRQSSIGLGYRVPLVAASPWSRGGFVCSQVFDHTSSLQFLESFLSEKKKKKIEESNISSWRRAICGDLTAVFRSYNGEKIPTILDVKKGPFIESIHKAKFKKEPSAYRKLTPADIEQINLHPSTSSLLPKQEKGVRDSCPVPYELYVDGKLNTDKKTFEITFEARHEIFGSTTAGAPFIVYAPEKYVQETLREWTYAAAPGSSIKDSWLIDHFENKRYHLLVYGPNGFFCEFKGNCDDPLINILLGYEHNPGNSKKLTGNVEIKLANLNPANTYTVDIIDNAYKTPVLTTSLDTAISKNAHQNIICNLNKSFNWYDITVKIKGNNIFEKRYAGHVETGKESKTDPAMGMVI